MNKSEFLTQISSLSREEIQKKLLENNLTKKKLIYPVIKIEKRKENDDK